MLLRLIILLSKTENTSYSQNLIQLNQFMPEMTCLDMLGYFYENARTKRKMQGRHKKLFLGSLRASRAIENQIFFSNNIF